MFEVCKTRCNECLFSANKIVSDKRKKQVIKECYRDDAHFVCHKATIKGKDTCCRGFYDADPGATNLMRIAGRLRAIEFVNVGE